MHLAEEWFAGEGLPGWTARALGRPIGAGRFLAVNGVAWPVLTLLTVLGIVRSRLAWFPTTLATIMVVNACLHALGTLATSTYSPGLVTGLLLYLPLGLVALAHGRRSLDPSTLWFAVLLGIAIHAGVAFLAFAQV